MFQFAHHQVSMCLRGFHLYILKYWLKISHLVAKIQCLKKSRNPQNFYSLSIENQLKVARCKALLNGAKQS